MGVCNCSMFCCSLLYVHSSIAIVLSANHNRSRLLSSTTSWCLVMVKRLFLAMPQGCLRFVIVVFPDHTHLLFLLCLRQWLISPYRQTLCTWIRLLLGEQFNPDPHCLLQRLDLNNLAEHKWRFAGVLMMAQHCWLSANWYLPLGYVQVDR